MSLGRRALGIRAWFRWREPKPIRPRDQSVHSKQLERFPITWNHVIEKESLKFKELEHVRIEKVEQLF
jgi:hypothetical protein